MTIKTKAGRSRQEDRKEPHWEQLRKCRHIGWRPKADTWNAKMFHNGKELIKPLRDAHDYDHAVELAEKWFAEMTGGAEKSYKTENAAADYVKHVRIEKGEKSAHEADLTLKKNFLPLFKGRELASITTDELNKCRAAGLPTARAIDAKTEDAMRKAKATSNRSWSRIRAACALAFQTGKVPSDIAWRRVKPYGNIDKARTFYPTPEQVADLLTHSADDFRPLADAGKVTGFRLQPLTDATVAHFDAKAGTLRIDNDKGHARTATLSSAAIELFKAQAKDKLPAARLFTRADGSPWGKSHQQRPFR